MAFGFGFGMPRSFAVPPFSPASLFANGEQGWWYDPSNYGPNGTLFQDSAGTTPVTAMEQPVGLQLDLSKGLALGPELVTGAASAYTGNGTVSTLGDTVTATCTTNGVYGIRWTASNVSNIWARCVFEVVTNSASRSLDFFPNLNVTRQINAGTTVGTKSGTAFAPSASGGSQVPAFIMLNGVAGESFSVRLVSVRELPGNHRFQTTSANRPVVSSRVNLLTKTEEFNDAAWTKSNATVTANSAVAPNGTTTADTLTATANLAHTLQAFTAVVGVSYTPSVYIKRRTGTGAIRMRNAAGTTVDVTSSVTSEWNQITVPSVAATSTGAFFFLQLSVSGDAIDIWGADLRVSNVGVNLPVYQRVNTSTDYDSTGFPIYIKPNGSNQFMQTNSINFSATDKMTVWQGVRKLSLATTGALVELGTNSESVNGSFGLFIPTGASQFSNLIQLRGTARAAITIPTTAPVTEVLSVAYDIGATDILDEIKPRINGAIPSPISTVVPGPAGTGNYGNYPAYFYARAGTSLFFNGHDYGSIARGAASTAAQITAGETWINLKTKAYQS